jgi:rfaE bifunctional protein kinase chain/domain
MSQERIKQILELIHKVKIAVYGDFCLDAYWIMDPGGSEISLETGIKAEAVYKHYYSPGGASNITANLAALKPGEILSIGVLGDDIYARELKTQLSALHVNTSMLITQKESFNTYVFTKKITYNREGARIDFGTFNKRNKHTDELLIKGIRYALENYDILIFNQQVPRSITNETFIDEVNKLFTEFEDKIVLLDSRHYNEQFENTYRKVNDRELIRLDEINPDGREELTLDQLKGHIKNVYKGKPIFVTCGQKGIISMDRHGVHHAPGLQLLNKLDTVGAGDTTLSALACCLAAGILPEEAAVFANFAAAVTVQKLFTTGTANGDEIISISSDPDYVYNPDLANNVKKANYLGKSSIEICIHEAVNKTKGIKHILFDNDGTLSTLRQDWECVMQDMMVKAIIGGSIPDKIIIERIEQRVKEYIELSTGLQTIIQMEMLVKLVREFNLFPDNEILDKFKYKSIYLEQLLKIVNKRIDEIRDDPKKKEHYTIKGASGFLEKLKKRGIKLYLASGTDIGHVEQEASILGYADFFESRIYGSVDDVRKYSKKVVIEDIIRKNHLNENEFAVIGDGPVEIREGKKKRGICIGVASDEKTGQGLDVDKRRRLISAGADIIITDYLESDILLNFLFG